MLFWIQLHRPYLIFVKDKIFIIKKTSWMGQPKTSSFIYYDFIASYSLSYSVYFNITRLYEHFPTI